MCPLLTFARECIGTFLPPPLQSNVSRRSHRMIFDLDICLRCNIQYLVVTTFKIQRYKDNVCETLTYIQRAYSPLRPYQPIVSLLDNNYSVLHSEGERHPIQSLH